MVRFDNPHRQILVIVKYEINNDYMANQISDQPQGKAFPQTKAM